MRQFAAGRSGVAVGAAQSGGLRAGLRGHHEFFHARRRSGVSESLKDAKSCFVVDADRGRAPSSGGGGLEIGVRWWGDNRLEIEHEPFARVVRAEPTFEGIAIAYGTAR